MAKESSFIELLRSKIKADLLDLSSEFGEVTVECRTDSVVSLLTELRDRSIFAFDQLMDVCAVDYLQYGEYDWETESATEYGFSRAVAYRKEHDVTAEKPRFAVVYHLLSTTKNQRLRVKVFLNEQDAIPSVHNIWKSANWFEREAYDLYGILFEGHPDLRRILTDYGFIGHPFRKDFPVSGQVEMRYDAHSQQVIYEPVDIEPRVTVPKVIRHDNRYLHTKASGAGGTVK